MATPSHEGDLNVMEMSRMLRPAERPRTSLGQAPTMNGHGQSLHQHHGASHPQTLQLPTAWQNTARKSRDQDNKQEVDHFAKSPAPSPAGPVSVPGLNLGVEDMLIHIRRSKLTEGRPVKPVLPVQNQLHHDPKSNVCLIGEDSGRIKWVQPSGPRRSGEGTEDEEQGIVSAETTASGGAVIRITLLAAGFIIGPSGSSVREVSKQTGADIKSWTEKAASAAGGAKRPVRSFVIEGKRRAVVLALDIICDAVDRYKELCEGAYCGQFVPRIQRVRGVDFSYQPPPRNIVPYAAALKGQHPRLSRADEACPAAPFKRPAAPAKPQAVSFESMSSTSNDQDSDMDTDCYPAHKTNPQHMHSKADVMKSYMKPIPMSTNYSRPQNSATLSSSKKSLLDVPDMSTTPGYKPSHMFDTHYQSQFCTAQPECPASSTRDVNSWLEHCKVSSNKPSQGSTKPGPAVTAPPAGLVEVRPNVWVPSLAIQQAQGNFALAVHIAAQGGNFPSEQLPTETSYLNLGTEPAIAQFGTKQAQPESPSQAQFDSNPHASIKASYKHHVKDHYATGNIASFTPRSNSMSPVSIADPEGTFDSTIEQEAMHNPASKYMTDYQHYQQQQHSLNSVTAGFDSAYNFKSPVVGVPYVDPSNSFISPQCVLDTNSLFSYNLASGIEPASKPSNTGWYATATPPLYQATPASDSSSNPHSNSTALGGNAFSTGGNDSAWPAYSNYWQSSASPFSVGHATDAFVNAPMKQPPQHVNMDSAPGTGSTAFSAWGPSAVNQLRHSSSQNSTVCQHGAYYQPGFLSPLKMPWVQGSHPLLRSKGHN